jgi:DNA-directed RNA polymerase alpha subunit
MMKLMHSTGYLPRRLRSDAQLRFLRVDTCPDLEARLNWKLRPEQLYQQDIDTLALTPRTLGTLRRSYINSVGMLLGFDERALLQLPQLGAKTLQEIKCALEQRGLRLGDFVRHPTPAEGLSGLFLEKDKGGPVADARRR